jgi:hypothetical protein
MQLCFTARTHACMGTFEQKRNVRVDWNVKYRQRNCILGESLVPTVEYTAYVVLNSAGSRFLNKHSLSFTS